MQRADCHCHTHFSDGSLSVRELLELAQQSQLTGLAITDHDTVDAYPEAQPLAKTLGLSLVSGIEISTIHLKRSIHVLGYAFDLYHPDMVAFCQKQQHDRHERNQRILEKLAKFKIPITMEELTARFGEGTQGRPHMARLMVEKGYVSNMREAFDKYLGEGKRCYVPGFDVSVEQAIDIIHRAGGFAVLAHPYFINAPHVVKSLTEFPFDGLEVHYGVLTVAQEKPWLDLARKKDWLITGGSDFHGDKKLFAKLGCSYTPEETFKIFEARFSKSSSETICALSA